MAPSSHLHPRSTATSTLFAGTLLASFIVVGIPHVFPCPRPRRGFSDSEVTIDKDGNVIRKVKRRSEALGRPGDGSTVSKSSSIPNERDGETIGSDRMSKEKTLKEEALLFKQLQEEAVLLEQQGRECPVPKPGGALGRWLGFQNSEKQRSTNTNNVNLDNTATIMPKTDGPKR